MVDSNILAGYLRRGALSLEQIRHLQAEAEALMAGFEFEIPSADVLTLLQDSDCSAYDCEFVALARRLNCPLFTMDKKLLKAFPGVAVPLLA